MGWRIVRAIMLIILTLAVGLVIYNLFDCLAYSGPYPYPTIAGDVHNWHDRFFIKIFIGWPFYIVPLFVSVFFVFFSTYKIRKRG